MNAFYFRDTQNMELRVVTFLLLSGRAVMYPIYKGTYNRGTGDFPQGGSAQRDLIVQCRKDLAEPSIIWKHGRILM